MCGIIGILRKKETKKGNTQVAEAVQEIFEDQASRGTQGFGITKIENKGTILTKRKTQLLSALLDLRLDCGGAKGIVMHHRQPTSSPNKLSQTHPIFVSNPLLQNDYLVVHNGVMQNEDERKVEHEKLGFKYTTQLAGKEKGFPNDFNDSEAIAIDFAMAIEELEQIIMSRGSAALIAIQLDKNTGKALKIHLWRGTNPLNYLETEEAFFFSSTGPGEALRTETLLTIDIETNTTLEKELKQATYTYTPTYVPTYTIPSHGHSRPESTIGFKTHEDSRSHHAPQETASKTKTHAELMEEEVAAEEEKARLAGEIDWDSILENKKVEPLLEDLEDDGETLQSVTNKVEELFISLESAEEIWTLEAKKELQKTLSYIAKLFLNKYEKGLQTVTEILKVHELTKDNPPDPEEYDNTEWQWSKSIQKFYGKDENGNYIDQTGDTLTNLEYQKVIDEEKEEEAHPVFSHALQRFYTRDLEGNLRTMNGELYDEDSVRIIEEEEAYDEEYAQSLGARA